MASGPALPRSKFAFLTLPNYSLIAVSNAVEPLRMANRVAGQEIYEWSIVSLDGRPVLASCGLDLTPTIALDQLGKAEILFVCGGINIREAVTPPLLAALRRLADRRQRVAQFMSHPTGQLPDGRQFLGPYQLLLRSL